MYELLNGPDGNVVYEIQNAARCGCRDAQTLFVRMWIMIQGIASMTISGEYDFRRKRHGSFWMKLVRPLWEGWKINGKSSNVLFVKDRMPKDGASKV